MIKKTLFIASILLFMRPFGGFAQIISADAGMGVIIMPFAGFDDPVKGIQFYDAVVAEVNNQNGYHSRTISAIEYPEILYMSPDSSPGSKYLRDSKYVLTGEFYSDTEDLQHFQMWLWDSSTGSLVYTDEMVSDNHEESLNYIPILVNWFFSQIPPSENYTITERNTESQVITKATTADNSENTPVEESKRPLGRLYLGIRGGATFNTYSIPQGTQTYEGGLSRSFSYEAALLAEFRIMRFLGIQMEAVFIQDIFKVAERNGQGIYDKFKPMTLILPLLIKMPIDFEAFNLSIYAGLYGTLPLGKIRVQTNNSNGIYTYTTDPPFGVSFGMDLGFPLGPGSILFDLRYNRDLGMTNVQSINRLQYTLERIGLSLGYKFLLWKY